MIKITFPRQMQDFHAVGVEITVKATVSKVQDMVGLFTAPGQVRVAQAKCLLKIYYNNVCVIIHVNCYNYQ